MVNIISAQHLPRKFLEQVIFFVCAARGTNHAERAALRFHFAELRRHSLDRFRPGDRLQFAIDANHRRLQAFRMMIEIEGVTALDAKKLFVDAAAVAIVGANNFVAPRA